MGLAEKRGIEDFKTNVFPALQKNISDAAKFPVTIEVKWETLAADGYADSYKDFFTKIYFNPLIRTFQSICRDKMGQDSLKGALKKVLICNENGNSSYNGFSFENGVLKLDHRSECNVDDENERVDGLTKLLEQKL